MLEDLLEAAESREEDLLEAASLREEDLDSPADEMDDILEASSEDTEFLMESPILLSCLTCMRAAGVATAAGEAVAEAMARKVRERIANFMLCY